MRLVVLTLAGLLELLALALPGVARADDLPEERVEQLVAQGQADEASVLVEERIVAHRGRARAILTRFSRALLQSAAASDDQELRAVAARARGKAPAQRPEGCSNAEILERLLSPTTHLERTLGAAQFFLFQLDR
jgi:hypothetical protein